MGSLAAGLLMSNQVDAVLRGLEAAGGDPGNRQARFRAALHHLSFDPQTFGDGKVRVDKRGQGTGAFYLFRVERDPRGNPVPREFRRFQGDEQTFGGLFGPKTPPFSRTSPACKPGNPPPWARVSS
jgi:branched-chain amino acid transport system substrate-binding protein